MQVPVFAAVCNNRVSAALNVNGCSVGIDATSNVLYSVASPFSSKFGRHDFKDFTRLQAKTFDRRNPKMQCTEHFDRVSRQNLKFQFEFEYCAPFWANECSCGKMLWAVCRRMMLPCLGDVSVLFRYSWCCFECFGEVSVVWSCLGDVAVTFQ